MPGAIVLFGSGETGPVGREALRWLRASGREIRSAVVLETPAGFEPNAEAVAAKYARFLRRQSELRGARVEQVAARRRGTAFSPDDAMVAAPVLAADLVALGAGSPTYAARQLRASAAWSNVLAAHLAGASLLLASAAAIACGTRALPVYEIYKVGEDPHWAEGLALFAAYGLDLAVVTHWNNAEGGAGLDTSRCFMGGTRFAELLAQLPSNLTVVGIDEHTALALDPSAGRAEVLGAGGVTVIAGGSERRVERGTRLPLRELGPFALPDVRTLIPPDLERSVAEARRTREPAPPPAVSALLASRERARAARDWPEADRLREEIAREGWQVEDTPAGPRLLRGRA